MKIIQNFKYPETAGGILNNDTLLPLFRQFVYDRTDAPSIDFVMHPFDPKAMYERFFDPNSHQPINITHAVRKDAIALIDDWQNPEWAGVVGKARNEILLSLTSNFVNAFYNSAAFKAHHEAKGGKPFRLVGNETDKEPDPEKPRHLRAAEQLGLATDPINLEELRVYIAKLTAQGPAATAVDANKLLTAANSRISPMTLNAYLYDRGFATPVAANTSPQELIRNAPDFMPAVEAYAAEDYQTNAQHVVAIVQDLQQNHGVIVSEDDVDTVVKPMADGLKRSEEMIAEPETDLPLAAFEREFQILLLDAHKMHEHEPYLNSEFDTARQQAERIRDEQIANIRAFREMLEQQGVAAPGAFSDDHIKEIAQSQAKQQRDSLQLEAHGTAGEKEYTMQQIIARQELTTMLAAGEPDEAKLMAAAGAYRDARFVNYRDRARISTEDVLNEAKARAEEITEREGEIFTQEVLDERNAARAANEPPEQNSEDVEDDGLNASMAITAATEFDTAVAAHEAEEQDKLMHAVDAVVEEVQTMNGLDVDFSDVMDEVRKHSNRPSGQQTATYAERFEARGNPAQTAKTMARFSADYLT